MATSNTVTTRTGTGWTVDVTACNLDPNLLIKDFAVLHAGVAIPNSSYTKTTRTTLTYNGTALATNTSVEIRRKTPSNVIQPITYASRFSSALWNSELDRKTRWQEEADLNGVGALASGSLPVPRDDAYSSGWDGDILYPPTRNAVYDKVELLAPKASPTFTGTVTGVNYGVVQAATSNTTLATHGDIRASLDLKANLSSPIFSGTPNLGNAVAVTQTPTDKSTSVATTQFVDDYQNNNRPHLFGYTNSIAVPSSALTSIGSVFFAGRSSNGFTQGANSATPNYIRVNSSGWFKVSVRIEEINASSDYWFFYFDLRRWNGTSFIFQKAMLRQFVGSGSMRWGNPIFHAWAIVPISWEAGADKILAFNFQQNNDAAASRNFTFEVEVERISY